MKLNRGFSEIRDVFNELAVDENTRAAILSGNGRSFCAGLDLKGKTIHVHPTRLLAMVRYY